MRIDDAIFFSPSLKLEELNLNDKGQILKYFPERIKEYYLKPVAVLVDNKMAFAAGALECLLIDALARYSSAEPGVGKRIADWCESNLGVSDKTAKAFYQFFRCGLLHEGHIKQFGQFCFDESYIQEPLIEQQNFIVVNPKYLLQSIEEFFTDFMENLATDANLYNNFHHKLSEDFGNEVVEAKKA
ncbi:hypothetical protein [Pedobacter nototheniae]|uniref:hypothetical protein n=1 Tax=Pedobacter nototheniae TaxID=2488994 RepID=UPI00103FD0CD|nr:hypothetical protein [Pedobacter nototheniae]